MSRENLVTALRIVNALLNSDQQVTAEENHFIQNAMNHMGFSDDERSVVAQPMSQDEARSAAANMALTLRKVLFETLTRGALVDGVVDPEEKSFIDNIGLAMKLDDDTREGLWEKSRLMSGG